MPYASMSLLGGPPVELDLRNAESVRAALMAGARANREAACRAGSIDRIEAPGTLIATGDLHDNPLHLSRLVAAAGMIESRDEGTQGRRDEVNEHVDPWASPSVPSSLRPSAPAHLVLHEI